MEATPTEQETKSEKTSEWKDAESECATVDPEQAKKDAEELAKMGD